MKLYVEMDELQLERYKESLKKQKDLTDYTSIELAAALMNVIQKEGGSSASSDEYLPRLPHLSPEYKRTSVSKIVKKEFVISLIVEKYLR